MIRCIAAIDTKRGIADDHGIPWQGKVPSDIKYYRDKVISSGDPVIMGYGLYRELTRPYGKAENFVASREASDLREGFQQVTDAHAFLEKVEGDIWNLGGAMLFESTIDLADELYLTLLDQDFHCTKFFPTYEDKFELVSESEPIVENGITMRFTIWKRK
jgi:dihydrofolate reductase